ncbi:hypothetical protein O181_049968 [Austropuccinia psidii MF-1]|uniref:Uncharacterized protein n=1 Tax=Austropuccinia psidii MF-1 TaxID=1389203 RepID=A0A9Q3E0W1_9BASI|nr:hypothetical protein [Austropuccinia psidii MF-1]
MELESVNIKVPNDLLSFSLLGKLGGDCKLHQFVDSLTLNKELIKGPDLILTRLKDCASMCKDRNIPSVKNSSTLFTKVEDPHKTVYFCRNRKQENKTIVKNNVGLKPHISDSIEKTIREYSTIFLLIQQKPKH